MRKILLLCLLFSPFTFAANTGGVFGPKINPQDRSIEFRYGNAFGENGMDDNFATRLHYQHALNANHRLRAVAQYRDNGLDQFFDEARFEWHYQFQHASKTDSSWDAALRLDFVVRESDRPRDVMLSWTNQWQLGEKWKATAVFLSRIQTGENNNPGLMLASRYSLNYSLGNGHSLAMENFFNHGWTRKDRPTNEDPQQIGISANGKVTGLTYKLLYLHGVSSVTPDNTVVLWLTKAL